MKKKIAKMVAIFFKKKIGLISLESSYENSKTKRLECLDYIKWTKIGKLQNRQIRLSKIRFSKSYRRIEL